MANVLTTSSTVSCPHFPGKVAVSSNAKLSVNGSPVLAKTGIAGKQIGGCKNPTDSSGNKTCTTVVAVASGETSKLSFNGQAVMLENTKGTTDGTPQNDLSASANQGKLTAI